MALEEGSDGILQEKLLWQELKLQDVISSCSWILEHQVQVCGAVVAAVRWLAAWLWWCLCRQREGRVRLCYLHIWLVKNLAGGLNESSRLVA